jgi:hypothetical protein
MLASPTPLTHTRSARTPPTITAHTAAPIQHTAHAAVPILQQAAVLDVPFLDPLTTMSDASLPLTVKEWRELGNPTTNKVRNSYCTGCILKEFGSTCSNHPASNNNPACSNHPACINHPAWIVVCPCCPSCP